ncbi:MAG: LOG family protein [Spirochaetes bacterium]|jgi:hypothetical protein|nr:LOG family protein [Spirochaetota bacterium]
MTHNIVRNAYEDPDFMKSREARTLRIISEYLAPEKKFKENNILHTVVFFGSARIKPGSDDKFKLSKYYDAAEDFACRLSLLSTEIEKETGNCFYICTGGGPGIMEAANKGSSRTGSKSIGLNIQLPYEQYPNDYISPELNFEFHYFFMRKLWFIYHAKAIIVFPGGYGTLDELFETLTLVQTRKLEKLNIPILLYDKSFWDEIINFPRLVEYGMISEEDLNLFSYFSNSDEGISILKPKLKLIMENIHNYLELKFPI